MLVTSNLVVPLCHHDIVLHVVTLVNLIVVAHHRAEFIVCCRPASSEVENDSRILSGSMVATFLIQVHGVPLWCRSRVNLDY